MGVQFGLERNLYSKRKNRWFLEINGISPGPSDTKLVNILPPEKAARPSLSFKEMVVNHITEDVYLPTKPDWKPLNVTLYDLQRSYADGSRAVQSHPVWGWVQQYYEPHLGMVARPNQYKMFKTCIVYMVDGCGTVIEHWTYEHAWLQSVDFQTLDMSDSSIMSCDLVIRFARAYFGTPSMYGIG